MSESLFKNLANTLLRQGVAPRHVCRTIEELRHHYSDLCDEEGKVDGSVHTVEKRALARLGREDDLADEVLAKPELRSLASRWPVAIYGLGPVLAMSLGVVCSILFFAGGMTAGESLTGARYIPPTWARHGIEGLFLFVVHILPLVLVAVVYRQALLRRASMNWPLVGMVILSIVSAAFDLGGTWPATPADDGFLTLGFAYAAPFPVSAENIVRTAVNLSFMIGLMLWGRLKQDKL